MLLLPSINDVKMVEIKKNISNEIILDYQDREYHE